MPLDRLVLISAFTAGTLFRVIPYLERPSLWLDEARLALNIGGRSFSHLLEPLAYDQTSPPLFLWVEKLLMLMWGPNEYALRALPLLAGLMVPVLTYILALRLTGKREATLTAALTALSPSLVQHSIQLKPYEIDAVVCVGLLLTFIAEAERRADRSAGPWTAALGAMAVWLSATAVFVLAAIAVASWPAWRRRSHAAAAALGTWVVSFAVVYWWIYRPFAANPYRIWFWDERLLTLWTPGLTRRAYSAVSEVLFSGFVSDLIEVPSTPLATGCVFMAVVIVAMIIALGAARLARLHSSRAILLAGPIAATLIASLVGAYPIAARLTLFAVPLLMTFFAVGLIYVLETAGRYWRLAIIVAVVAILSAGQLRNMVGAADPFREGHLRPAVAFFERTARPHEPVYVEARALPAWTFYTTDWPRPDTARLAIMAREGSSGGRAFENAPSRGRRLVGDGAELVFRLNAHAELLGLGDGGPFRPGDRHKRPPDPGWAASEAQRIRQAATPTAWLAATESFGASRELDQALRSLGAIRQDSLVGNGVVLARYQFPLDSAPTR